MPGIENYVEQIRRATYGRDVREAIASGIEECYSDVTQAKTIADDSIAAAEAKAQEAASSAEAAATASQTASTAKDTAVQKAGEASQSATAAAQSVSEVNAVRDSIPADYTELSQSVVDLKSTMNNIADYNVISDSANDTNAISHNGTEYTIYVIDKVVPANHKATIKARVYADCQFYICLISVTTKDVIYTNTFSFTQGVNTVNIDYTPSEDCYIGVDKGPGKLLYNGTYTGFNYGMVNNRTEYPAVGETLSFGLSLTALFALSIYTYFSIEDINDRMDNIEDNVDNMEQYLATAYQSQEFEYNSNATAINSFLLLQPAPFDGIIKKIHFKQGIYTALNVEITVYDWDGVTVSVNAITPVNRYEVSVTNGVSETNIQISQGQYIGISKGSSSVCTWYNSDGAGFIYQPETEGTIRKYTGKYITLSYEMEANNPIISFAVTKSLEQAVDVTDHLYAAKFYNKNIVDTYEYASASHGGNNNAYYVFPTEIRPICNIIKINLKVFDDCSFNVALVTTKDHVLAQLETYELVSGANEIIIESMVNEPFYVALDAGANKLLYDTTKRIDYINSSFSTNPVVGDVFRFGSIVQATFACKITAGYDLTDAVNNLIESEPDPSIIPLAGKVIFLAGDSRSSTDYTFYKTTLEEKTGATVLVQGASGRNVAYNASDTYFSRLTSNPHDFSLWIVGGNDDGHAGSIGTFSSSSPLGQQGEEVVTETDISTDYSGTKFIQAIDHMMRKYKSLFYNFKTLNNGHKPKMIFCTDLPQQRNNASSSWSIKENWERKRLAIIECCEKNNIACLDLYKLCNFDMSYEPFWTSPTDKVNDNGLYFMDGLHPNQYGIDVITSLEIEEMKKYIMINPYQSTT